MHFWFEEIDEISGSLSIADARLFRDKYVHGKACLFVCVNISLFSNFDNKEGQYDKHMCLAKMLLSSFQNIC